MEAFNYVLENRKHWNKVALEFLEKSSFYTTRQTAHLFQKKREDCYQSPTSSLNQLKVLCRKQR